MNIITVIPLTRSKALESLSYFTASDAPVGAIVSVPVRSKSVHAIVTETRPAEDIKIEIKKAPYEIRKLGSVKATSFFPAPFIEAAKKLAHYYVGNLGATVDVLVADIILENANKIEPPETPQGLAISRRLNLETSTFAVQGDDDDRMSSWRSLIRQEFARKKSVVFYVPTIEDAENVTGMLTKGIEGYIFTLHTSLPKKKILEVWKNINSTKHPIVVVATAAFSVLPRADIDTVVIERENGRGWTSQKNPYLDLRHALETIAHASGQVVYRSDSLLQTETLRRLDNHFINQGSPFKWRSISLAQDMLVDMTKKNIKPASMPEEGVEPPAGKFRVISKELEELIRRNREESTHLFLYTARRGLSSMTVCSDCETVVSCNNCDSPVVLHASKETGRNFFLCHVCGERRPADEYCRNCGGWRLTALGVGIERVAEEIKELFPDMDVFKIDADSTSTKKQVEQELEKFRNKPGSVLLGTDLGFMHLREKIDHSAIVSMDSLLSLPDFRIPEKIMYTLVRLRSLTTKIIMAQTRRPEEKVFEYGLKGNLSDFYRETLAERKKFGYPPYAVLVKITVEGKKDPIVEQMAQLKKEIEPFEIDIFPVFTASAKGVAQIHGLIRIDFHLWPNTELIAKLKTLPPSVSVRVDPENLL